jgi:hypothetical protein
VLASVEGRRAAAGDFPMIIIRPNSRTAQFALSFAFLACSAQAERDGDPNPGSRGGSTSVTGGVSNTGTGGTASTTGGTSVTPTGGTVGTPTGGMGGSKAGGPGAGGTTAKGGTVGAGGTTGGTPGVIITGGGGSVAAGGTGGGGSAISCDMPWAVGTDGFVKAKGAGTACWHGYAFADATKSTSTADPKSFGSCGAGCKLCFKGSVGATVNDVAFIGFNLSQSPGSTATANVTPTGAGLTVSFTKTGTFPLRVQIQAKAATAETRWCYTIPATATSPVTIPYAMFNTECWEGGAGTAYAKGQIEAIMLLIPGNADAATPYDACLDGVVEN